MKENSFSYVDTVMEGMALCTPDGSMPDYRQATENLLHRAYSDRAYIETLQKQIEEMDHIARECGYTVVCKSCNKHFEPDCELSEIALADKYCGKNQWCTP